MTLTLAVPALVGGCQSGSGSSEADRPRTTTESTTTTSSTTTSSATSSGVAAAGTVDAELTVDGLARRYRLVVPDGLDGSPAPLVIAMHGNGTDGVGFQEKSGLDAVGARHGFLIAYPDAADEANGVWNGGFSRRTEEIDDVAFLRALVDDVAQRHPVDRARTFATGLSGGGMMSYRLACDAPDLVAAIGPVAATMVVECDPPTPVAVVHVHGEDDRSIPAEGRDDREFPPVADVAQRWAAIDSCDPAPSTTTEGPDTITSWDGCDAATSVEYHLVAGMDHEYGRTEEGAPVDVGELVWTFFSDHPRAG